MHGPEFRPPEAQLEKIIELARAHKEQETWPGKIAAALKELKITGPEFEMYMRLAASRLSRRKNTPKPKPKRVAKFVPTPGIEHRLPPGDRD